MVPDVAGCPGNGRCLNSVLARTDHSRSVVGPQARRKGPYTGFMIHGMRQICVVLLPCMLAGCGDAIKPSFDSPEPAARNAAIVEAASEGDHEAIPDLVRMLESDDPATRLLAITTLERLTGETHGYVARDKPSVRHDAVVRWQRALGADQSPPAVMP